MPLLSISKKLFPALACLLFLTLPSLSRAETVNRVVAIVNEDVITLRDLQQEGAPIFKRIRQEAPPAQTEAALKAARRELLGNLIDKKIIEQRAKQLEVTVSDQEVDEAFNSMLASKGVTKKAFDAEMSRMGASEEGLRSVLRAQILQSKLVSYEVRSKVVITDDKIKEYYDSHYAAAPKGEGMHILQIGVTWDNPAKPRTKEEARQRIDELRKQAAAGADFQQLAAQNSDLPSAVDGGDIGVFKKDEMAPYMRTALDAVQPGEVSQVVETTDAFQFFKLLSGNGGKAPLEAVKDDIRRKLQEEELQKYFKEWVTQLRGQADIKELL